MSYHDLTMLKRFVSQRTSKLCNLFFYLTTFSTPCMGYLLYLMFRCDKRCDGKFGNFVGTKHTLYPSGKLIIRILILHDCWVADLLCKAAKHTLWKQRTRCLDRAKKGFTVTSKRHSLPCLDAPCKFLKENLFIFEVFNIN